MKVFLDTNVIVSAVTTRGLCADVFRTVLAEHELITSTRVLQEVRRILQVKFGVSDELIGEYLELIEDDIEIVAAAVSARAHVLVTGDREVQSIKSFKNVRVMSPRAFWEELTANEGGSTLPFVVDRR